MLKTPKYPIWLSLIGKNSVAILFSTNLDLNNDWRCEQNFNLHFYSVLNKQTEMCRINIDTRNYSDIRMLEPIEDGTIYKDDKDSDIIKLIFTK
jgi:hypothetical protein